MRLHSDALFGLAECLRPLTPGRKQNTFYNALISADGETLIGANGYMIAVIPLRDCQQELWGKEINGIDLTVAAKLHRKDTIINMDWGEGGVLISWDAVVNKVDGAHQLRISDQRTVPLNVEQLIASTTRLPHGLLGVAGSIDTATLARVAQAYRRFRSVASLPVLQGAGHGTWFVAGREGPAFRPEKRLSILCNRVASAI